MKIIIIYFAIKYKGNWDQIYSAIEKKEIVPFEEIKKLEYLIQKENWNIITIIDVDYPQLLRQAYKPPFALWIKGDKDILKKPLICATGNQTNEIVINNIKKSLIQIENKSNIIALDFKGSDDYIKKNSQKSKVYVLACGINKITNDNDVLISEYPPDTNYHKDHFKNRNRIIAAFAKYLILFSSKKNGKINHLISSFLDLGKEIYCFPGNGDEQDGNSELIKQGANLITTINEI